MDSLDHHKRAEVASNRPSYREARRERAVKVYTVNQESKYVLVQNVHALGVTEELLQQFSLYGDIEEYRILDEYPSEPYTDVYWIKFANIDASRIAKKKLDNHSFFGKNLHVCYAPEYETIQDTREKLQERRQVIARKTRELCSQLPGPSSVKPSPLPQTKHLVMAQPISDDSHDSHVIYPPLSLNTSSTTPVQSRDSHYQSTPSGSLTTPIQSCDSHVMHPYTLPPLPPPPTPFANALSYPSSSNQPSTSGNSSSNESADCKFASRMNQGRKANGTSVTGSGLKCSADKGIFDLSGLSTEERVEAYLSSEDRAECQKVGEKRKASSVEADLKRCDSKALKSDSLTTASVMTPPPMSGSWSIDASINAVRAKMDEVRQAVENPASSFKPKVKKRKRI